MPTGQTRLNSNKCLPVKPAQRVHGSRWAMWYASHTEAVNKYSRNGILRVFYNGEDCHVTSIVKWLANGRLTIEAMSPKLVVSLL